MKLSLFKLIQISASLILVGVVIYQAGLLSVTGRAAFLNTFGQANIFWLFVSLIVSVLINMSSTLKWYMLLRAHHLVVGYWRTFCYYVIGQFCNLFLPTSVGGDAVRAYELGKYTGKHADALASVFVERYTGVLVLLFIAGLAVLSRISLFVNVDFVVASLFFFALILGLIGWMIFDSRFYAWIKDKSLTRYPSLHKVFDKSDKLLHSISLYKNDRQAIFWALVNSFVFYFIAVLNIYVSALVFSIDVSFVDMLIATPIIMLIMNIPLSVGNIGLMEFAYINVFQLMGYSPVLALSVAVLMRLKSLIDGILGGMLYPVFVTKRAQ